MLWIWTKVSPRLAVACSLVACLLIVGCESGDSGPAPTTNSSANNPDLRAAIEKNQAANKAAQPKKAH
jgi:hypothetical protein